MATLQEIPDKVLADMVRNGCYSRNANLDGTRLLVLAVPYSVEEAATLPDAFEGFRELLTADDWEERCFQVLTMESGEPLVREVSYEMISDPDHFICVKCGADSLPSDVLDHDYIDGAGPYCSDCRMKFGEA